MLTYPDFDPVIFSIGPLSIRWYGLMYVIGFVLAWWLARSRARRPHAPIGAGQVDDLIFYCMLGVILGGRLGYTLLPYGWDQLAADPLYVFKIWKGGMSFHGGLAGVMIALVLYARRIGRRFWEIGDFVAPLAPLGLGFGRIGNFINGELWGRPTDVPWGFRVGDQVLHPSQLYESALEGFLLFAILWAFSAKPRPVGAVSGLFLVGYGLFRSFVEFYRVPDAHLGYLAFEWLTMGQLLSLPMILLGAILWWFAYRGRGARGATA